MWNIRIWLAAYCWCSLHCHAAPILEKVLDGDTVVIRDDAQHYHLRLLDIDAPERQQAYGKQSRRSLQQLCITDIRVEPHGTDRYGRTLGHLFCAGTDAGTHQVAHGMAWFNQRFSQRNDLRVAQQQAQQQQLGLWQQQDPMPPWVWRKLYGRQYQRHE